MIGIEGEKSWTINQPLRVPTNILGRRACKQQKTGMSNGGRVKDRLISSILILQVQISIFSDLQQT